jgi:hypothetical protein
MLVALWLGLNVLRFYSYDPESPAHLYSAVVRIQEAVHLRSKVGVHDRPCRSVLGYR